VLHLLTGKKGGRSGLPSCHTASSAAMVASLSHNSSLCGQGTAVTSVATLRLLSHIKLYENMALFSVLVYW
jgi:hypothetical protein